MRVSGTPLIRHKIRGLTHPHDHDSLLKCSQFSQVKQGLLRFSKMRSVARAGMDPIRLVDLTLGTVRVRRQRDSKEWEERLILG